MQCHEAQQAPNHHRTEEGRRTSNIPGTCQSGILSGLAVRGGLLVVRRASWIPQWPGVAAHAPLVPRCDEVRRDGRDKFRAGHVAAGHGETQRAGMGQAVGLGCPDKAIGRLVMMLSNCNAAVSYQCPPP
ncbi:hypothetical protein NEUTE1DRAFT_102263 [Neurospora tetrasperma FGSC 2508]|uniref:Uncharacterized protein n=1 Tax=Neurospora tetrasperma (strain FGSC 2508 / ATCC MYA-4615 / P0657) TaxID=510951 RepID=F8MNV2_NEUT8|nr:uncharacterized protein NEUTE1DRAFT_102263 [Neurospora tetrasperma FGSC 2508]EGO57017.1 hypothetical protein NEUTE1DRAFT_102263 [Neurospora tetrasperma FGSC 2508]